MSLAVNKKSKRNKKTILIIALIVLLVISAGLTAYYLTPKDSSPRSSQGIEQEVEEEQEKPTIDNDEQLVPDQTIPQSGNPNQQPTVEAARINIPNYQASNGTLTVNAAISEVWSGEAYCIMNISGPTNTTVKEKVFAQAQISGCQLQATNLKPGAYVVTIYAEKGENKTSTETLNISL